MQREHREVWFLLKCLNFASNNQKLNKLIYMELFLDIPFRLSPHFPSQSLPLPTAHQSLLIGMWGITGVNYKVSGFVFQPWFKVSYCTHNVTYLSAIWLQNTYFCGALPSRKVTYQKHVHTKSNIKTHLFLEEGLVLKPQLRSRLCYMLNLWFVLSLL